MRSSAVLAIGLVITLGVSRPVSVRAAQTPQPFPKPTDSAKSGSQTPVRVEPPQKPRSAAETAAPPDAKLGVPVYPSADFIASYDAGRGQRYYLYGTNASFAQIVEYYRKALMQRGDLVYQEPPIHMFEVGRFREETMAFPPGVTVKDYTWAGSLGYLNPKRGAEPARFKTIIQIVPVPPR
jgi:hypothetical protein